MDRQECIRMLKIERDKARENEADVKIIDMYNDTINFLISDKNKDEIMYLQNKVIERSTYYGERKEV
jgi:hypothetical protein